MKKVYDPGLEIVGDQWIKLHRNENLFIDPARLTEICKDVVASLPFSQYPDANCTKLREKLGQIYEIDPDQFFIGNGSDEVLANLLHCLRERFSEVVTPTITYKVYPFLLERYHYQHLTLESASPTRVCMIDSPNSLTGETAPVFNFPTGFLIWDNVYGEFARDQLNAKYINASTAIIRSFSKFYGLANLRIGFCVTNRELVRELMHRKDVFNVNGFAQEMAVRVLEQKEYFDSLVPQVIEARNKLQEGLRSLGFVLSNSHSNSVWVTHPLIPAETIQNYLEKFCIAVRRFQEFPLSNHLRITVPPLTVITHLLEVLSKCV